MRKRAGIVFLVVGLAAALWLYQREHRAQHLRLVLGRAAPEVTRLAVDYDGPGGGGAELTFAVGSAPRVVNLEPRLPDGTYNLRIDVDRRQGRKTVERQVTLSGGSTSVDLVDSLGEP